MDALGVHHYAGEGLLNESSLSAWGNRSFWEEHPCDEHTFGENVHKERHAHRFMNTYHSAMGKLLHSQGYVVMRGLLSENMVRKQQQMAKTKRTAPSTALNQNNINVYK